MPPLPEGAGEGAKLRSEVEGVVEAELAAVFLPAMSVHADQKGLGKTVFQAGPAESIGGALRLGQVLGAVDQEQRPAVDAECRADRPAPAAASGRGRDRPPPSSPA